MRQETEHQYKEIISECKEIFKKKTKDYGTAWRILRLPSITDQIFIKAQRIRSIQEKGENKWVKISAMSLLESSTIASLPSSK